MQKVVTDMKNIEPPTKTNQLSQKQKGVFQAFLAKNQSQDINHGSKNDKQKADTLAHAQIGMVKIHIKGDTHTGDEPAEIDIQLDSTILQRLLNGEISLEDLIEQNQLELDPELLGSLEQLLSVMESGTQPELSVEVAEKNSVESIPTLVSSNDQIQLDEKTLVPQKPSGESEVTKKEIPGNLVTTDKSSTGLNDELSIKWIEMPTEQKKELMAQLKQLVNTVQTSQVKQVGTQQTLGQFTPEETKDLQTTAKLKVNPKVQIQVNANSQVVQENDGTKTLTLGQTKQDGTQQVLGQLTPEETKGSKAAAKLEVNAKIQVPVNANNQISQENAGSKMLDQKQVTGSQEAIPELKPNVEVKSTVSLNNVQFAESEQQIQTVDQLDLSKLAQLNTPLSTVNKIPARTTVIKTEQNVQQLTKPIELAAKSLQKSISPLVEKSVLSSKGNTQSMVFNLKPANLGEMKVVVKTNEQAVSLQFEVQNSTARDMLQKITYKLDQIMEQLQFDPSAKENKQVDAIRPTTARAELASEQSGAGTDDFMQNSQEQQRRFARSRKTRQPVVTQEHPKDEEQIHHGSVSMLV